MPYVENQIIHDADAHVMELPGTILNYMEAKYVDAFNAQANKTLELNDWHTQAEAKQNDAEFRAGDEANLLLRKNHLALGAYRNDDRVKALNTALGNKSDSPVYVARQILDVLLHDRALRYLGWPEKLFVRVNALFPGIVRGALVKQLDVIKLHANH